MSKIDQAVEAFAGGLSCPQAIISTYGPELGIDRATAISLAEGFAGGIAGTGRTCGAVTGSIMSLGLKYGRREDSDLDAKAETTKLVREFIKRFEAKNGSIACRDLIGCEIGTPEQAKDAKEKQLFATICQGVVRDAAAILEELLKE